MVWCAISLQVTIGPYFFKNENVTGECCKRMLRYFFFRSLRDYLKNIIFQQDDALPHYAVPVPQYLNEKIGSRWIGRAGPVGRPPRSPNLTACDFFLWGYIKDRVFLDHPNTIAGLKSLIMAAIASIYKPTLQKKWKQRIPHALTFTPEWTSFQK